MQPTSLTTVRLTRPKPAPNLFEQRFGKYAKGTVLPETGVLTLPRRKVADFPQPFINKSSFLKALDHNQQAQSCCRNLENHEIEGWKSHPDEPVTDRYEIICGCGRRHRFFCVGMEDTRPEWK